MCVLRATGRTFDVESFLASSTLSPYKVTTPAGPQRRVTDAPADVAGFRVDVSRAKWSELGTQVQDAVSFLANHRAELQRLRDYAGVEDVRLDFPIDSRLGIHVTAQFEYLSPELLVAAGSLGIGLAISIYPAQERIAEG